MTRLTDNQIELLRTAASADEGAVEAPTDRKAFQSLIKRGLFIAMPQMDGPTRLLITDGGRSAIGLVPAPTASGRAGKGTSAAPAPSPAPQAAEPAPKTPSGKIGILVALLQRPEGVTLIDAQSATGWQAHSVRGAISGAIKKKLGLEVTSEKTEAGRIYRIVAA